MFILLQTKDDHGSCIFPRLTQLYFFCVVWYLNGGNPQNIFPDPDTGSPASSLDALTQWNDLPLKPGDVIAHRFKNEWEECYAGSELSVNGVLQHSLMCTCTAVSIPLQFACLLTAFFLLVTYRSNYTQELHPIHKTPLTFGNRTQRHS